MFNLSSPQDQVSDFILNNAYNGQGISNLIVKDFQRLKITHFLQKFIMSDL